MKRPHNLERILNRWVAYDSTGYSVHCIKNTNGRWSAFCHGGIYAASTLTNLAALIYKGKR